MPYDGLLRAGWAGETPLARTLVDTAARITATDRARVIFDDVVVDHLAQIKQDEWRDFTDWATKNDVDAGAHAVTGKEFERYFVWV